MISVTSYAVCALHINAIIASVFASIEFQWNDQPSLCLEKKKFVENESFQIYSVCTYSPLLLLVVVVMVPVTICLVTNLNEYTDNIRIDAIDPDVETNFHLRKSYVSANRQKKIGKKNLHVKDQCWLTFYSSKEWSVILWPCMYAFPPTTREVSCLFEANSCFFMVSISVSPPSSIFHSIDTLHSYHFQSYRTCVRSIQISLLVFIIISFITPAQHIRTELCFLFHFTFFFGSLSKVSLFFCNCEYLLFI